MADFIPTKDADLIQFATNFAATFAPIVEDVGFVTQDSTDLIALKNLFQNNLTAHVDKQTAAQAATQQKEATKADLVGSLRSIAKRLQAHPTITDAMRADLGITIPASNQTSVGVPTSAPVLNVGTGNRLQHVINFQDELTPTSRAKPAGVLGCVILFAVGTVAPASEADYSYLTLDTATPYIQSFNEADAGKKAFYIARWQNRAGQQGPPSQVASATIVG